MHIDSMVRIPNNHHITFLSLLLLINRFVHTKIRSIKKPAKFCFRGDDVKTHTIGAMIETIKDIKLNSDINSVSLRLFR